MVGSENFLISPLLWWEVVQPRLFYTFYPADFVGTFTRDGLPDTVCLPVAILDSFTNSTSGMTQNAHVRYV